MDIGQLLQLTIERQASDLHLVYNHYPTIRIDGQLYQMTTFPILTKELNQQIILSFLNNEQKSNLQANKEIDLAYEYNGNRFRVNIYTARSGFNASLRLIPEKIKSIEELALPQSFHHLADFSGGLVLVTGRAGQGKSTTLASIINEINTKYTKHIITIEDPIEYVYPLAKSVISQRELHEDTFSWNMALRSVLREDPDVLLVGEMRDYESTQYVLNIAETGHLVFSTVHTASAPETIHRLIDMFPGEEQNQVRTQLAGVLRAVVSQRLLPREDVKGRIPAIELLFGNAAVASIIRDGKPFLLNNVLQTSEEEGFIYFEKYLNQLYLEGKISKETAIANAIRPKELEKYMK